MKCATKSVILHLQWREGKDNENCAEEVASPTSADSLTPFPIIDRSPTLPVPNNPLMKSTSSLNTPQRRISLNVSTPRSRPSLPATPSYSAAPLSPSPRNGTPTSTFAFKFGQAAVLTAPPDLVAIVDTPDIAVGAVDARKRRVVTATRFSSRAGADRRVCLFWQHIQYKAE